MAEVAVTIYTSAHRIVGTVWLRERLSEALNDSMTDYVEVNGAQVSKLIDPTHTTVNWRTVALPKPKVLIATLDLDTHESEATRQDKSKAKSGSSVAALVGGVEVYGTAHLTGQGSSIDVLRSDLAVFFPITDASLQLCATQDSRIATRLALVNRQHVSAFTLL